MNVVWSPLALEKLSAYARHIALDNPIAAQKWVNDVFDKAETLAEQPQMGRKVPELSKSQYREIIFGHYRIIYSVTIEVRILTVRNTRQLLSEKDLG